MTKQEYIEWALEDILEPLDENTDIIISCSSDKTVKIHSIEDTVCFKVMNFEDEVVDMKKIIDYTNKENYIISFKNGRLKVYNSLFKEVLEISNRSNINEPRFAISLANSNYNEENKEVYILVTEKNNIDIYKWNKKVEIKSTEKKIRKSLFRKSYKKNLNNRY